MDELEYEPHLERWKRMYGAAGATPSNLEFIQRQAQHEHALAVWNPLFDLSSRSAESCAQR